jgi:flagellar basal body L-ring protein FlgH
LVLIIGPAAAMQAGAQAAAAVPASGPADSVRPAAAPNMLRASWLSDRQPLRVGDIITIVVDEQTHAREQTSTVATANRSHHARLGIVAVISVRVTELDPAGNARVEGLKNVSVDGRTQVVQVKGLIRPDDVSSENTVPSSRVADAVISYKGKKIGPRQGILGKLLSLLWP